MKDTFLLLLLASAIIGDVCNIPLTSSSTPRPRCLPLTDKQEAQINMVINRLTQVLDELDEEIDDINVRIINLEIDEHAEDDDEEKELILQVTVNNCPRIPPQELSDDKSGYGNGTCTTGTCNPDTESKSQVNQTAASESEEDEETQSLEANNESGDAVHSSETSDENEEELDADADKTTSDEDDENESQESKPACDVPDENSPVTTEVSYIIEEKSCSDSDSKYDDSKEPAHSNHEEIKDIQSNSLTNECDSPKEVSETKTKFASDSDLIEPKTCSSSNSDTSRSDPDRKSSISFVTESPPSVDSNAYGSGSEINQEEHSDCKDSAPIKNKNDDSENQESYSQIQDKNKYETEPSKQRNETELYLEDHDDKNTVRPELMYLHFLKEEESKKMNKHPLLAYIQKMSSRMVSVNFLN